MRTEPAITNFARAVAAGAACDAAVPAGATAVYARLVRARLRGLVQDILPRTAACLGADGVARLASAFAAEAPARSPIFRELAAEVVKFLAERPALSSAAPTHTLALARYELTRFSVANAPDDDGPARSLQGDQPVRMSRAAVLFHADHEVHGNPGPGASDLLIYRGREDLRVHVLALSESAAGFLGGLFAGLTLAASLAPIVQEHPGAHTECATLLADLAERGVLLGGPLEAP